MTNRLCSVLFLIMLVEGFGRIRSVESALAFNNTNATNIYDKEIDSEEIVDSDSTGTVVVPVATVAPPSGPCYDYTLLADSWRHFSNANQLTGCDNKLVANLWYRFKYHDADAEIPAEVLKFDLCGTRYPMTLVVPEDAKVPAINSNNTVGVSLCIRATILDKVYCMPDVKVPVQITSCQGYYVYKLLRTLDDCPHAICVKGLGESIDESYLAVVPKKKESTKELELNTTFIPWDEMTPKQRQNVVTAEFYISIEDSSDAAFQENFYESLRMELADALNRLEKQRKEKQTTTKTPTTITTESTTEPTTGSTTERTTGSTAGRTSERTTECTTGSTAGRTSERTTERTTGSTAERTSERTTKRTTHVSETERSTVTSKANEPTTASAELRVANATIDDETAAGSGDGNTTRRRRSVPDNETESDNVIFTADDVFYVKVEPRIKNNQLRVVAFVQTEDNVTVPHKDIRTAFSDLGTSSLNLTTVYRGRPDDSEPRRGWDLHKPWVIAVIVVLLLCLIVTMCICLALYLINQPSPEKLFPEHFAAGNPTPDDEITKDEELSPKQRKKEADFIILEKTRL